MAFLNLESLYADHDSRRLHHQAVYERLLYQCHRKIQYINRRLRILECYFQIPIMIPGLPLYPREQAALFIERSLRSNGLWVVRTTPTTLYISWRPEDIDHRQYEKSKEQTQNGQMVSSQQLGPVRVSFPQSKSTGKGKKEEEPSKVALIRFNGLLDDMVPVNREKLRIRPP